MRNKLLIIFCFFVLADANAQYGGEEGLTSRFRAGFMWFYTGIRPAKVDKVRKYDRLVFDVVYNDWSGDAEPFQNHWASIGLNTNLMFDIPLSTKNNVAFGIGVAHQLMRICHDNIFYKYDSPQKTEYTTPSIESFDKNVLGGNMFAIPVELRFRKEKWRHFKFHIGGKVGYQANMFSKLIYDSGSNRSVIKDYGFPDLNRLVYGAHVRMGLRNWALYASYNFNTMFQNAESTKLNQLQFGLSISLF